MAENTPQGFLSMALPLQGCNAAPSSGFQSGFPSGTQCSLLDQVPGGASAAALLSQLLSQATMETPTWRKLWLWDSAHSEPCQGLSWGFFQLGFFHLGVQVSQGEEGGSV